MTRHRRALSQFVETPARAVRLALHCLTLTRTPHLVLFSLGGCPQRRTGPLELRRRQKGSADLKGTGACAFLLPTFGKPDSSSHRRGRPQYAHPYHSLTGETHCRPPPHVLQYRHAGRRHQHPSTPILLHPTSQVRWPAAAPSARASSTRLRGAPAAPARYRERGAWRVVKKKPPGTTSSAQGAGQGR